MSWDDLSMREKAAMMRVAVKNKIFDIDNIKKQYNSYAEGGPTQKKYPTYNELINNPEYGLVQDTFNGKLIYRQPGDPEKAKWFYASRAEEAPNQTVNWPIATSKQADNYDAKWFNYNQPATMNYISQEIDKLAKQDEITQRLKQAKQKEKDALIEAVSWVPVVGEIKDLYDAGVEAYKGNYGAAAAGIGLMFLPEWAEKGVKKGGKWLQSHASDLYYGLKNKFKKEDNIIWEDGQLPTFDLTFSTKQQSVFKNSLHEGRLDFQPNINEWEEAQNIRKFWNGITMPKYKKSQNDIVAGTPLYPTGNFYFLQKDDPKITKGALGHSNGKDAYIYEVDNYNKSIPLDEVVVHEGIHNFRDQFDLPQITVKDGEKIVIPQHNDSKYTEQAKQLLDDAYVFDDDFLSKHPNLTPLAEKGATNTQLQYYLAKKYNAFEEESLNRNINNLSDDDILYYLWQTNGYGRSFTRQLTDEQKIDRALKIRKALKGVYKHGGKINRF